MEFNFFDEIKSDISKEIFLDVLEKSGAKGSVSLTFVSKEKIQELNKEYREKDKETDVLSFEAEGDDLGDIFICYEVAKKQAEEYGEELEYRLRFLFIHGVLHLLGYDHKEEDGWEEEEGEKKGKEMYKKMEECLK